MGRKITYRACVLALIYFLLFSSFLLTGNQSFVEEVTVEDAADVLESAVKPVIRRPYKIDRDGDGVQDSLESTVLSLGRDGDVALPVVVTLANPVGSGDLNSFRSFGGRITHVYEHVTYGFAGFIPAKNIRTFAEFEGDNLVVIEYDAPIVYHLDVSTVNVRARPIVWNTYGYMGSSNLSVAILDTGVDDSHPDIGPYGDLNFSRKIVGWYDATSDGSLTPEDYGEHGSHVAGIAVGTGAANGLQGVGDVETTFTYVLPDVGWGYIDYIDVMSPGVIKLNLTWGGNNNVLLRLYDPAMEVVAETSGGSQPLIITYDTTSTPYPTGRYGVLVGNLAGPSGTQFSCVESYPYVGLNDGYNLFSGVAPNSRLVGVKVFDNTGSGTVSTLLAGMDWIIENKVEYGIAVASMSLGLADGGVDTTLDQKADTLVLNGIVTTVAAGNDFPDFTIGSPGTAAYVITVAATNDLNNITSYSSNGNPSKNEFGLIKPDVAAPGGTFQRAYGNKIVSVDSNDLDAGYTGFSDRNPNDYQQMAGTSMSTPHVAGLAALMIDALGGWNWTLEEALKVKMIIGMTAFEVQTGESSNVPPLNRGEKDSVEGYGRINADAAIEALIFNYSVGERVNGTLGSAPWDKKVWARRVSLSAGVEYEFRLEVPSGADYDLYVYNGSPDSYGEPIILEKSVNATVGADEAVRFMPANSGSCYVVVKWVSGDGVFNLTSVVVERDVAVVDVDPSVSTIYIGGTVSVFVEVKNNGTVNETFNVTAYYNDTAIGTQTVLDLAPNGSLTLTFKWDTTGVSAGDYIISAVAEPVPDELDVANNSFIDGSVRVRERPRFLVSGGGSGGGYLFNKIES